MDKPQVLHRRVRHTVELAATVKRDNGQSVRCTISDLSLEGCRLSGFFKVGERIEVAVRPIGTQAAEIRWAVMGTAGARFIPYSSRAA
jgi:hypothetical protein